jgi:hypothetical protein
MVGNPLISTTSDSVPKSILALWSRIAQANISVRMYGDLVKVANQPPGWRGERSLALSEASLKSFLDFWTAVRGAAVEPELSLAPDGSLLAEWFKSPRQRLDVRFLENKVLFGLFANNSILEGAEHLSVVAQILGTHPASPLKWGAR